MSKETLDFVPPLPPKNNKISSAFSYNFKSALTVLTVTVADGDQFKDTNIYVKVGATGTINVKSAEDKAYTVADYNIKALIGVTGGAVEGSYKTAAAVPELAIGKVLNSTTGVDLTFIFDAADAAAGVSALKVTFTEA